MLAAGIAQSICGNSGLMAVAAISGLADVDAVTLSVAGMGPASPAAVLIATAVNSTAKSAYGWYVGGSRRGLPLLVLNLAAIAVAAVACFLLSSNLF